MVDGPDGRTDRSRASLDRRSLLRFGAGVGVGVGIGALAGSELAGDGEGGGGGTETLTPVPVTTSTGDGAVTPTWQGRVAIAADANVADAAEAMREALWTAGLPSDVHVEVLSGPNYGARRVRYERLLDREEPSPALFMMSSRWVHPFVTRGQAANLSSALPEATVSRIETRTVDGGLAALRGPEGDLYGVPLFVDVPTMQYRKDLLRTAGYGDGDFEAWAIDPPTWQEFSEVVAETRDATEASMGFSFQADQYVGLACCSFREFVLARGGAYFGDPERYLFGPVGDRPITVGERPVRDAVRLVRTFVHGTDAPHTLDGYAGGISPPEVLTWTEEPSRKPFTEGEVVALRNWRDIRGPGARQRRSRAGT